MGVGRVGSRCGGEGWGFFGVNTLLKSCKNLSSKKQNSSFTYIMLDKRRERNGVL
jgi:hypothetical protein